VCQSVCFTPNNGHRLSKAEAERPRSGPRFHRCKSPRKRCASDELPTHISFLGSCGGGSVAKSLNNLAALYHDQGKYAEAEPLYQRAMRIDEKAFGPDHPGLATDLNNLAELYRVQGRYAEAEPLYKRSLAIKEKSLGPEHPDVATSLENYADLLRETERVKEAEELETRAHAIRTKHAEQNPVQ